jgi:hypothetical protein
MWAVKTDLADRFVDRVGTRRIFNCIPLDPTPLLYRFEAYKWKSPTSESEVVRYEHDTYLNITRIRLVSWPNKLAATWLLQVRMPHRNNPQTDTEDFYLPVNDALPHERLLVDLVRDAFKSNKMVKFIWRDSYFYGDRQMIDEIRVVP